MRVINERPAKMKFANYKEEQNNSRNQVKRYLKGTLFHKSSTLIPKLDSNGNIAQPLQYIGKTKGVTFVGKCDKEKAAKIIERNKKRDSGIEKAKQAA